MVRILLRPAAVVALLGLLFLFALYVAVVTSITAHADQVGRASWYGGGEPLNRHTANGEVFRSSAFTCAHRTLPFGTHLRVTHVASGRTVVCRVNDRGPAKRTGRVLDLARGCAVRLGIIHAGEALVRIHVMRRPSK